jgi:outer membrane protein TolC
MPSPLRVTTFLAALTLAAPPLMAQEAFTLRHAVDLALHSNPLAAAADAREKEAEARIHEAHSGYLPHLQFSESLQRGNNPVFVFSSLLTQHHFGEANFAVGSLNRPDAMNNYQSQLTAEQVVFDARQTARSVEAARFTRQIAGEDTRRSHSDIALNVLRAYFGVTLAERTVEVARQSVDSARADLERAESIYQSCRSTLADVLALRVQPRCDAGAADPRLERSGRHPRDIERRAWRQSRSHIRVDDAARVAAQVRRRAPEGTLEEYRGLAAEDRPEMRQAELAQRRARTQQQIAFAAYWPQIAFQGTVETDRQNF